MLFPFATIFIKQIQKEIISEISQKKRNSLMIGWQSKIQNVSVLNNKLTNVSDQFTQFLKDVQIPQYKSKLQDYLCKSTQQKVSIIGFYKNQNQLISYQAFAMKKQQMFLKIKLLDKQINIVIKNTQINLHNFILLLIFSLLLILSIKLEYLNEMFLQCLFNKFVLQTIIILSIKPFKTEKRLLYILLELIKSMVHDDILQINMKGQMIIIEFPVENKILYHTGYGQAQNIIHINQPFISMIILDKDNLRFY
ncbi:hypothetical protein pb186bvf_013590 [Paramecium bursaria]